MNACVGVARELHTARAYMHVTGPHRKNQLVGRQWIGIYNSPSLTDICGSSPCTCTDTVVSSRNLLIRTALLYFSANSAGPAQQHAIL